MKTIRLWQIGFVVLAIRASAAPMAPMCTPAPSRTPPSAATTVRLELTDGQSRKGEGQIYDILVVAELAWKPGSVPHDIEGAFEVTNLTSVPADLLDPTQFASVTIHSKRGDSITYGVPGSYLVVQGIEQKPRSFCVQRLAAKQSRRFEFLAQKVESRFLHPGVPEARRLPEAQVKSRQGASEGYSLRVTLLLLEATPQLPVRRKRLMSSERVPVTFGIEAPN